MKENKNNLYKKNTKKIKLICVFLVIILIFTIFYFNKQINNRNNNKKEFENKNIILLNSKELLSKFKNNYSKTLAYLGLNQFILGLTKNKIEQYKMIFNLFPDELYIQQILNSNLKTASTPLIQGTIDFLGKELNQKIKLSINNNVINEVESIMPFNEKEDYLYFRIKNERDHFFINDFKDTDGDGYCFFNAIVHLLEQKKPNWRKIVFSEEKKQILKEKEIENIISNLIQI